MPEPAKLNAKFEEPTAIHLDTRLTRLPWRRRAQIPVIAAAAVVLVRTIGPTLRIETPGYAHTERLYAAGRHCVFSFWHRGLFPMLWNARDRSIMVLSSNNFDGQWASRVTRAMGFGAAFGSSSRGGLRGLAVLAQHMAQGYDAAITVDGPRGPRYVAKVGPVLLAKRTGCPIICFHAHSERGYTFEDAWDQLQIPYPFSRVVVAFGPPIDVPESANRAEVESKHAEMQRMLERLRDTAESWFSLSPAECERERASLNAAPVNRQAKGASD
jgi:lysophospholipid acyltransferase (LPLAT)-like uncharacterized protein